MKEYNEFLEYCEEHGLLSKFGRLRSIEQRYPKKEKKLLQEAKDRLINMTEWLPEKSKLSYRSNVMKHGLNKDTWECPVCREPRKMSSTGKKFLVTCGKKDQDHKDAEQQSANAGRYKTRETSGKDYSRTEEAQLQAIVTHRARTGYDYPFQVPETQAKSTITNLEKRGVKNAMQDSNVVKKGQDTCLKIYGDTRAMCNPLIKNKWKIDFNMNHGVDNPLQVPEIREKIRNTNLKVYGFPYPTQASWVADKIKESWSKHPIRQKVNNLTKEFIISQFISPKGHIQIEKFKDYLGYSTVVKPYQLINQFNINYTRRAQTSEAEEEIVLFLKSLDPGLEIIQNSKSIISPYEIDIYLPDKKIAIEYNGLMWHSQGISKFPMFNTPEMSPEKHLLKTELCEKQDIQLLHIFENEWIVPHKREIWKSMIRNKLGLNTRRFGGRELEVKELVSKKEKAECVKLINDNHMQGSGAVGPIRFGLFKDEELISVMTFGRTRHLRKSPPLSELVEIIRFVTLKNTNVMGGAKKLLKAFEKNYKTKKLVSYANRRWSKGDLYSKIGFTLDSTSIPGYYIFHQSNILKLEHRINFQKHKLEKKLEEYDPNIHPKLNVMQNGYRYIFDSGNRVFSKIY